MSPAYVGSPNQKINETLYDGQTKEMLTWISTHGPGTTDDSCFEFLNMPVGRTSQQINDKILELMADDRQQ